MFGEWRDGLIWCNVGGVTIILVTMIQKRTVGEETAVFISNTLLKGGPSMKRSN